MECLGFGPAESFRVVSWKHPWPGGSHGQELGSSRQSLVCAVGLGPGGWELGCAPSMKQELEQQPGNQGLLMGTRLLCWKVRGRFVGSGVPLSQKF